MKRFTLLVLASVGLLLPGVPRAIAQSGGPPTCPTRFWIDPATGETRCISGFGRQSQPLPSGGAVAFLDHLKTCTPFLSQRAVFAVEVIRGPEGDRCVVETYVPDETQLLQIRVCRFSRESIALQTDASAYRFARALDQRQGGAFDNPHAARLEALEQQECAAPETPKPLVL